ncbi:hypothetical protein GOB83_01915 [Acetobacter fabarum]|jgi:hypothetical protein|uniref:hypothetical protein n=1 Tax=Acetobacter TaxID=434 RepID=UPI000A3BE0BF|nr:MULTISPECIES: hypothetical protein [Acetobacter]MDN6714445.1 hypothetical protein [Acetobacter sp.]MCI1242667.1 hypothetical protein [Acetobacter fabarum]MCI1908502.1 hypothetical protein [Acetobacter fabarum]MCI1926787.1 hypothetical protein [Acetobacter fabarum]MCI1946786.1 hypothetical protein [Acetobacter fabarum]
MRSASRRFLAALALSGAWALPAGAETVLGPAMAEVTFKTRSADLGVGYTWGNGVLTYGGHDYPFEVSGASAAAIGFSSGNSVGKVYNLQRLEDFAGTYWSLSGETTVGKGVAGHLMENDSGVRIRLDEIRTGGRLAASPSRLTIRFLPAAKKTGTDSPTKKD